MNKDQRLIGEAYERVYEFVHPDDRVRVTLKDGDHVYVIDPYGTKYPAGVFAQQKDTPGFRNASVPAGTIEKGQTCVVVNREGTLIELQNEKGVKFFAWPNNLQKVSEYKGADRYSVNTAGNYKA